MQTVYEDFAGLAIMSSNRQLFPNRQMQAFSPGSAVFGAVFRVSLLPLMV